MNNQEGRRLNAIGDQPLNFKYGESSVGTDADATTTQPGQPGQPATPRMLRSVSGSLRNSKSDVSSPMDHTLSPTPRYQEEFPQYLTAQNHRSHSRNPSFQQQPPTGPPPPIPAPSTPSYQPPPDALATPQSHRRNASGNYPITPNNRQPSGQGKIKSVHPQQMHPQQMQPQQMQPQQMQPQQMQPTPGPGVPQQVHQGQHQPQQIQQPHQNQGHQPQQGGVELLPPVSMNPHDGNTNSTMNSKSSVRREPVTPRREPSTPSDHHRHKNDDQKPFHRKSIGDWDFIKTIGAGSMGKVKLAKHSTTGEICAVKIVPRAAKLYERAHHNDPPPKSKQDADHKQKEYEKELARDRRTVREGVLGRLLFHPFVCRLYEIVPMSNHYYMLFEYVGGGQMLDYIVAHGSLKEKHTRKFARGIVSALDYCHRNNVVHRDLKIENIMINEKGDIKIIDFGLSNLYSPKTLLNTYCGSLYFAAPELLCARPYVGPEVDVWSFGIVLYVLVCGKVPFDDQSVSVLHEKIKKGTVEYPEFLSGDLKTLLASMIQVDPSKRATLHEIMNNPWMNKGYEYCISNHLPKRVPLTLPLDDSIIKTIASFDLGSYQTLTDELSTIVASVEYQMSSENWYRVTEQGRDYASASNAHILPDPTGGFHPLVSIYYLVEEMKRRKKAKEDAVKAQLREVEHKRAIQADNSNAPPPHPSQLPLHDTINNAHAPEPLFETPEAARVERGTETAQVANNRGPPVIVTEQPKPTPPPQMAIPISPVKPPPTISFPEQAHTTGTNKSSSVEPRKESTQSPIPAQQPHSPLQEPIDGNKGINSLFRRLSAKKKGPLSPQRTPDQGLTVEESPSKKDPMVRRGVSMKVTAKERAAKEATAPSGPSAQVSQSKKHSRSQSINSNNNKHGFVPVEYLPPLPNIDTETNQIVPSKQATSVSGRKLHPTARSKSLGGHIRKDSQGRHKQGQQPPLPNQMASQNSDELVGNKEEAGIYDGFFDDILFDDDVEVENIPQLTEEEIIEQFHNAKPNTMLSIEYPKTIYLKGFFSVQTTSTKPLPVIRYTIINVLSRSGVRFQEVKGGFVCSHVPSLQSEYDEEETAYENEENERALEERRLYGDAFKSTSSSIERAKSPEPVELNSQLSGGSTGHSRTPSQHLPTSNSSSNSNTTTTTRSRGPSRQPSLHLNTQNLATPKGHHKQSSSISSIGSERGHRRKFSIGNSILANRRKNGSQTQLVPPNTPAAARVNRSLYGELDDDFYDEERPYVEDDSIDSVGNLIGGGSDMLSSRVEQRARSRNKKSPLKFEIHVVKFPLVGLYGVQFKKLVGNTWNYKTLAGQILSELKL